MEELLRILEKNARMPIEDIAAMLDKTPEEVAAMMDEGAGGLDGRGLEGAGVDVAPEGEQADHRQRLTAGRDAPRHRRGGPRVGVPLGPAGDVGIGLVGDRGRNLDVDLELDVVRLRHDSQRSGASARPS